MGVIEGGMDSNKKPRTDEPPAAAERDRGLAPKASAKGQGKSGAGKPAGGKPDGKPDGGKPDGGKPDGGKPDGGKPDGGKPDGGKPDGGKPDGGKPGGGKPGGGKPDGGKPDGKAKDWGKQLKGKGPLEGKAMPAGGKPKGAAEAPPGLGKGKDAPAAAWLAAAKDQVDPEALAEWEAEVEALAEDTRRPAEPRGVSPDEARALQEAVEARRSAEAAEAKMAAAAAEARKAAEAAEARMAAEAAEARRAAEAAEAREAARHQAEVHTPRSASWQRAGGYGGGQPLPPEEVEEAWRRWAASSEGQAALQRTGPQPRPGGPKGGKPCDWTSRAAQTPGTAEQRTWQLAEAWWDGYFTGLNRAARHGLPGAGPHLE